MKGKMILRAYGDSWTEGQGAYVKKEKELLARNDIRKFRNEYSWVKLLSDKLEIENVNNGLSGQSNLKIFNDVVTDIMNGVISNNDLVIILWSSSLRDNVPFLPNNEWLSWSIKQLFETSKDGFIKSYKSDNKTYDNFLQGFKEFFVTELFNQNYYNIVNQNYIIFLQKLLENYNIKYLMCDAFESMVNELHPKDDVTKHINKKAYWKFGEKCFKQLLIETKLDDVWEPIEISKQDIGGIHPNEKGYKIIMEEMYNYLLKEKYV